EVIVRPKAHRGAYRFGVAVPELTPAHAAVSGDFSVAACARAGRVAQILVVADRNEERVLADFEGLDEPLEGPVDIEIGRSVIEILNADRHILDPRFDVACGAALVVVEGRRKVQILNRLVRDPRLPRKIAVVLRHVSAP